MARNKRIIAGAGAAALLALSAACSSSSSGGNPPSDGSPSSGSGGTINLVAFSTPQKAYDELGPAFAATSAGAGSSVKGSYGPSGTQERQVEAGQSADVVEFSRSSDMDKLVAAGIVDSGWNTGQYKGIVTDSVATLIVRKGNPLHIQTWDDLVKPGVQVVTPNPLSSGSACWNLMAAYGAELKEGKSAAQALAFVKQLLQHTVSLPDSGSDATAAFVGGTGNVLIGYENEAISAQQAGDAVDYVTPKDTILIENPVAVTKDASDPTLDKAFVDYLYSDAGQKIFAAHGYRPVVTADLDNKEFPTPSGLFTIDSLGGWSKVNSEFFDATNGSITKILNDLGHGASG
ncbi:MAG TPA: sulfate ABC transporter substrate-binding protein [Mycobacteriales bacterium]|nr:sulfate ABC transporter substrate-binding protein [Mycobacteriales bacterium]